MGTRSKHIENFMQKEKKHKHLIFILNKCDLVPTWVTVRAIELNFLGFRRKLFFALCLESLLIAMS